jgi:hypothetical protein
MRRSARCDDVGSANGRCHRRIGTWPLLHRARDQGMKDLQRLIVSEFLLCLTRAEEGKR